MAIKEKNKKIVDSESRGRLLSQKLCELEAASVDKKDDLGEKFKKTNDKLTAKMKDLKKAENNFKNSEDRAAELLENNIGKSKKISELENANARLRLLNEQSQEIDDKIKNARRAEDKTKKAYKETEKERDDKKQQIKCRY